MPTPVIREDFSRRCARWLAGAAVAGALLAATGGAAAQSCTFRNPRPSLIQFSPDLDPSAATTRTAFTTASIQCIAGAGSPSWTFTGANGGAPLRLKHASASAYIPYSVSASYVSGGTGNQQWSITATILGPDYENALVGNYSDSLIVQISP